MKMGIRLLFIYMASTALACSSGLPIDSSKVARLSFNLYSNQVSITDRDSLVAIIKQLNQAASDTLCFHSEYEVVVYYKQGNTDTIFGNGKLLMFDGGSYRMDMLLLSLLSWEHRDKVGYQTYIDISAYIYGPLISESCSRIVFTDSLLRQWDRRSLESMRHSMAAANSCRDTTFRRERFIKGDDLRLDFARELNNSGILQLEDLQKGFYIIEDFVSGDVGLFRNFLIVKREEGLKMYHYVYSEKDTNWYSGRSFYWELKKERVVDEDSLTRFVEMVRSHTTFENIYGIRLFNLSIFTSDGVESYVSYCKFCAPCIKLFNAI